MRNPIAATLALLSLGGAVTFAAPPGAGAQSGATFGPGEPAPLAELQLAPQEQGGYATGPRSRYDQDQYDDQRGPTSRVWLENDRDLFSPGALTRVFVRSNQDAYVAVVHITPDGDVDFLWPRDPDDDGYLEGGRALALSSRTGGRNVRLGYGYGIGYVFAVTSDEPLDLRRMRSYYFRRTTAWNADYNVVGDPFRAMERFARDLVPGYEEGYGSLDYYTYHVGSSRYRYPRYACYDSYGSWYSSRSPYYDSCDRVRVLLVQVPYYYDTRYYRGDRSLYWRRWYANDYYYTARRRDPQHGYKEGTYSSRGGSPNQRPLLRGNNPPPARDGNGSASRYGGGGRSGDDDQQEPRVSQPTRTRPTLQRRPAETDPVYVPPRSEPRSTDRAPERRREEPRSEPRSEPRVREQSERPRESPPARSAEPRRESPPPSRGDGGGGGSRSNDGPRVRPRQ